MLCNLTGSHRVLQDRVGYPMGFLHYLYLPIPILPELFKAHFFLVSRGPFPQIPGFSGFYLPGPRNILFLLLIGGYRSLHTTMSVKSVDTVLYFQSPLCPLGYSPLPLDNVKVARSESAFILVQHWKKRSGKSEM